MTVLGCSLKIDEFIPSRNDGTEFGGSIYQKVNDKLETAVNLAWTAGNSNTRFGIAAKYQIDPDASFSVSAVHGYLQAFENRLLQRKCEATFTSIKSGFHAVLWCIVGPYIHLSWLWQHESTAIGFSLRVTQNTGLSYYWALFREYLCASLEKINC